MKDENEPPSPDEVVVRLIWSEFHRPETAEPIRDRAFRPREDDTEGLSVFRAACLNDPRDALTVMAPEKRDKYVLALIPMAELTALGLTLQPAKIDEVPGHAVIPELNYEALVTNPVKCLETRKKLAALAAKNLLPSEPKP